MNVAGDDTEESNRQERDDVERKLEPLMVKMVPPALLPTSGLMEAIVGVLSKENCTKLLVKPELESLRCREVNFEDG